MIMVRHFGLLCLIVLLVMTFSSCMFMRLSKDLEAVETKEAFIRGRVSYQEGETAPLLLLLFTKDDGEKRIVDFSVLERPGLYAFMVPRGTFYVAAFIDGNQNMLPDDGEIFGVYGSPDPAPVVVDRSGMINGIDLTVDRVIREEKIDQEFWSQMQLHRSAASAYISAAGVVADLDDRHFSPEYAQKGLWEPYDTLKRVGIGLYFLEDYAPQKTPVLFVYGASGHAQNWRVLFEKMDRRRFQPWFFNYPSGLDLEFLGDALNGAVKWLHDQYRFDHLFVVAHSMGGLVARYAILKNVYPNDQDYIRLLVTISTPWGGHAAAAKGVKYAPAVVPSWRDMVPDSAFIANLYERPLPETIPHYLFFSYSGRSGVMDANNDGAVTLESQLDYRVQRRTRGLYGFDEDHVRVLFSDDVVAVFNAILKNRANELPHKPFPWFFDRQGGSPAASRGISERTPHLRERH